jgi:hypothetical protein
MTRFALLLVLSSAGAVWATHAVAFEANSDEYTSHGTPAFTDLDDNVMPGMLQVAPDLQDYQGTANQLTPDQSGWIFSIAPQRSRPLNQLVTSKSIPSNV